MNRNGGYSDKRTSIRLIHWIAAVLFFLVLIKQPNDHYKETYGMDAHRDADFYIDAAATWLKRHFRRLVTFVAMIICFGIFVYKFLPASSIPDGERGSHRQETDVIAEQNLFTTASECIKRTCPADSCLTTIKGDVTDSQRFQELSRQVDLTNETCAEPVIPTPRKPASPLWQRLSDLLTSAIDPPSAADDEQIRSVFNTASVVSFGLTENERRLAQKAEMAIARLTASDTRLKAIHDAANAWRKRSGIVAGGISSVLSSITNYDMQRVGRGDYQADLDTLKDATALLSWPNRGLSQNTRATLPVFLDPGTPHQRDAQIAMKLRQALGGTLRFEERQAAALFIEIDKVSVYTQHQSDALELPKGRASFDIRLTWIDGTVQPSLHIDAESSEGDDDLDRDRGLENSAIERGVYKACAQIALPIGGVCRG